MSITPEVLIKHTARIVPLWCVALLFTQMMAQDVSFSLNLFWKKVNERFVLSQSVKK